MTSLPSFTAAAPAATSTAPIAAPTVLRTLPRLSNLLSESLAASPASSISSPMSSALSVTLSISRSMPSSASSARPYPALASSKAALLSASSRSMSLSAASALFSWICHACVLRSFSPKDSAAFSRAARRTSIFCFCASISLFRTVFREVSASTDLSFLSNWDATSFISDPRTLKEELMSASAFLNSFSPSRPIFNPKLSAIWTASFP